MIRMILKSIELTDRIQPSFSDVTTTQRIGHLSQGNAATTSGVIRHNSWITAKFRGFLQICGSTAIGTRASEFLPPRCSQRGSNPTAPHGP